MLVQLFKNWSETVEGIALGHLKNFILAEKDGTHTHTYQPACTSPSAALVGIIQVNFHNELGTIIRETKYLDQLGWKIPETALSVTLQVRHIHRTHVTMHTRTPHAHAQTHTLHCFLIFLF